MIGTMQLYPHRSGQQDQQRNDDVLGFHGKHSAVLMSLSLTIQVPLW